MALKKNPDAYICLMDNDNVKIIKKTSICLYCGKEIPYKHKFCDITCQNNYEGLQLYEDFLNNNEKYCKSNYTPRKQIRDYIIKEQGGTCAICQCKQMHNNKPLVFVLDHIDGDASNNARNNLRMICPNCDSQLDTFKSKNKNSTRRNY